MPEHGKLFQTAEETERTEVAQINGTIPSWLKGSFVRVGPGKFDLDGFTMNHWFDGYSILSKFTISGDFVSYEKKYLASDAYKRAVAAKRPVLTEYGTRAYSDPNKGFFSRLVSACLPIELTDNNSINLFQIGQELFATGETCFFRKIDSKTLSTGEKFDTNKCFGVNVSSAHPLRDDRGVTYTLGSSVLTGLRYNIVRIGSSIESSGKNIFKSSKIIATINSSWSGVMSYNHSFGMSKNWIIFIEQPYVMNIAKAAVSYLKGGHTFSDWLEWRGNSFSNKFYLIDKETGKITRTEFRSKDPFFFLHVINAYDDDGHVVLDLVTYKNPDSFKSMNLSKLRSGQLCDHDSHGTAVRYVIPVVADVKEVIEMHNLVAIKSTASAVRYGDVIQLTPEVLTYHGIEMPVISRNVLGKKHGFFYAVGALGVTGYSNSICKFDVRRNVSSALWKHGDHFFPGEPVFVPNPKPSSEDDGVIISAVTDSRTNSQDFILFLDAQSFKELARVKFSQHIPTALHGIFLPQL